MNRLVLLPMGAPRAPSGIYITARPTFRFWKTAFRIYNLRPRAAFTHLRTALRS